MGPDLPQTTRRRWLTLAVALATASAPSFASARMAPAPTTRNESPTTQGWAHVAVDTSQIGEAGPVIRRRVQERADVVLRRAGVMPGRGPQDPTIGVVIHEITGNSPGWEYAITISRAEQPAGLAHFQSCELCTETELVDAIEGRLATIAADLESTPTAEPTVTSAPDEVEPTREPLPVSGPGPTTRPRGLSAQGKAAVALLALGGAGMVAGIVLAVLPARPKSGDPTHEVFTQPPGYAALGTAGVALVVGAVLLALDRKASRRNARQFALRRLQPGLVVWF